MSKPIDQNRADPGQAIASAIASGDSCKVSDEELALLATGRIDELDEHGRDRVLNAIAADSSLAALVVETHEAIAADQAATKLDDGRHQEPQERISQRSRLLFPAASGVWAAAACLLVASAVYWGSLSDPTGPQDQKAFSPTQAEIATEPVETEGMQNRTWAVLGMVIGGVLLAGSTLVLATRRR